MKRGIRYILIPLFAVLAMSHNVSALELGGTGLGAFQPTTNGNMGSYVVTSSQLVTPYGDCSSVQNSLNCTLPGATVIQKFRLLSYNQIPAGSIVTFSYYLQGDGINGSFHGMSGGANNTVLWQNYTALDGTTISGSVTLYVGTSTALIELGGYDGGVIGWVGNTNELASFSMATWVTTSGSPNYSQALQAIANNTNGLADTIAYQAQTTRDLIYTQLNTVSSDLQGVIAYQQRVTREEIAATIQTQVSRLLTDLPQDTADAITETEEAKVQDAADEAEAGADDAKNSSQQATSSLLSTVTGVFNAIINASATNCRFDSHLPFMSGNGTIDLCAIPAPPIVQGIGSLIALGLFAPFALHMFRRFISITESFQR